MNVQNGEEGVWPLSIRCEQVPFTFSGITCLMSSLTMSYSPCLQEGTTINQEAVKVTLRRQLPWFPFSRVARFVSKKVAQFVPKVCKSCLKR